MLLNNLSKAGYKIDLPECKETLSQHLSPQVISKCLNKEQRPINPHSQRLLTAEARAAQKVPKGKAKPAEKDKPKAKAKSKKEKEQESEVPRTEYMAAKKQFMSQEEFLG